MDPTHGQFPILLAKNTITGRKVTPRALLQNLVSSRQAGSQAYFV